MDDGGDGEDGDRDKGAKEEGASGGRAAKRETK